MLTAFFVKMHGLISQHQVHVRQGIKQHFVEIVILCNLTQFDTTVVNTTPRCVTDRQT